MTRRFLSFLTFLLLPVISFCQQPNMEVQRSGETLFLEHTVAPKENFYSIGRLYNVAPRDLSAFNHISLDKGLNKGQRLRIPLDKNNFTQSTSKNAAEALIPLYHVVAANETLFRIGMNYGNIPLNTIKKWNHLESDQVNKGAALIIGYLKVNKSESAFAKVKAHEPTPNPVEKVVKNEAPGTPQKDVVKEAPKKETPKKETPQPEIKEETKKSEPATPAQQTAVKSDAQGIKEGYFKKDFINSSDKQNTGTHKATTAIFKSTSGWQDEKYYCFNNDVTPGSILKISIPGTEKSVYAKVLDAIPDIKQNEGIQLVLSNAAASELGISDEKFETTITFVK